MKNELINRIQSETRLLVSLGLVTLVCHWRFVLLRALAPLFDMDAAKAETIANRQIISHIRISNSRPSTRVCGDQYGRSA